MEAYGEEEWGRHVALGDGRVRELPELLEALDGHVFDLAILVRGVGQVTFVGGTCSRWPFVYSGKQNWLA